MKNIATEETGAVAVIVAIMLTVFIVILAFVADVGYMYEMRRQLQSAADAGALAAMREKINGGDPVPEARAYATRNDLVGTPFRSDILDLANSDFNQDDYVIVAVQKPANLFFAPLFFGDSQMIRARAKARRVYVTGTTGLVPWGMGTINDPEIEARVGADPYEPLSGPDADNTWQTFLDVPADPNPSGYLVDLRVTNDLGYVDDQTYQDVVAINVDAPGDSVRDVWLSNNNVQPGETTWINVEVVDGAPAPSRINNQLISAGNFQPTAVTNVYKASITAPSEDKVDAFKAIPIEIKVQNEAYANAAVLIVSRIGSPISAIDFGATGRWWQPGGATASINVEMRAFVFGQQYVLALSSGQGITGNFNQLNFSDITRDGVQIGGDGNSGGDYYRDNLADGYDNEIRVGDVIAVFEGVSVGPTTQGMRDRFSNCPCGCAQTACAMPFDGPNGWVDAGQPANCARLVTVPIVEFGSSDEPDNNGLATVVDLAVFFVEPGSDGENIIGRFVEYAQSGTYSDFQASPLSIQTVRLDGEGIF